MPAQNASKAIPTAKASELTLPLLVRKRSVRAGFPPFKPRAVMSWVEKSEVFTRLFALDPFSSCSMSSAGRTPLGVVAGGIRVVAMRNCLIANTFSSTLGASQEAPRRSNALTGERREV
jgi:hypothetical protein